MSDDTLATAILPTAMPISVPLPFGGTIGSLPDISAGPPTEGALAYSVMMQLTPLLSSLTCILNILKVIKLLPDVIQDLTKIGDLISAVNDLSTCFGLLNPIVISGMVRGVLHVVIAYIGEVIGMLEQIVRDGASMDLDAAQGNPALTATLETAQENLQTAVDGLNIALGGIQPLLEVVNVIMQAVGLQAIDLSSLSLGSSSGGASAALETISGLRDVLQRTLSALPG